MDANCGLHLIKMNKDKKVINIVPHVLLLMLVIHTYPLLIETKCET